jgi:hypothetical protein
MDTKQEVERGWAKLQARRKQNETYAMWGCFVISSVLGIALGLSI